MRPSPDGSLPSISLLPAPRCEPPYDDEHEPDHTPHRLGLSWPRYAPLTPPHDHPATARTTDGYGPDRLGVARVGDRPPGRSTSEAGIAVRRFLHLCVEVINGYRPATQLRRMSRPIEAAEVVNQGLSAAQRVAAARREKHRRTRRVAPVALAGLRLCEPRPGAVEAAAALITADRTYALALRMELYQDSWSATAFRLI